MTKCACIVEQRTEVRNPAQGGVWFALDGPDPRQFQGSLVDYSTRGFRAAHPQTSLTAGQRVLLALLRWGLAVVMWTASWSSTLSGFLTLEIDPLLDRR
jgi:hypothetical protein